MSKGYRNLIAMTAVAQKPPIDRKCCLCNNGVKATHWVITAIYRRAVCEAHARAANKAGYDIAPELEIKS